MQEAICINDLNERYFKWICNLIGLEGKNYNKVLSKLFTVDFRYLIDTDGNRETDGIDLRYRFGYVNSIPHAEIAAYLDCRPCSVLEMMAALALRCEESIMSDPAYGNRIPKWFFTMMQSLGLNRMNDDYYNDDIADYIINVFLDRAYFKNGKGGLFTLHNLNNRDMRDVEIWCQMCWYLDEKLYLREELL